MGTTHPKTTADHACTRAHASLPVLKHRRYDRHVTLEPILNWFRTRGPVEILALVVVENLLLFWATIGFGKRAAQRWAHRRVAPPVTGDRSAEWKLGYVSVAMNSLVTIAGWWLWRRGTIDVHGGVSFVAVVEVAVLAFVLDAQMYFGHVVAHHRWLYPLVHRLHHRFVEPQAATLFALHPLECLGFGAMWLVSLVAISGAGHEISALGVGGFAFVNLAFGTVAHLGVDPFPNRVRSSLPFRHLATPSFHVGHHLDPSVNFGFFSTIWDRMFGTIDRGYDSARLTPLPTHADDELTLEVAGPR